MSDAIELTAEKFDATVKKGDWVVDFWASWCGPCKTMGPEFEAAAREMKGKVHFGKVNVEDHFELSDRFNIMSIPTTMFFRNGKMVGAHTGAASKEQILKLVKENF